MSYRFSSFALDLFPNGILSVTELYASVITPCHELQRCSHETIGSRRPPRNDCACEGESLLRARSFSRIDAHRANPPPFIIRSGSIRFKSPRSGQHNQTGWPGSRQMGLLAPAALRRDRKISRPADTLRISMALRTTSSR